MPPRESLGSFSDIFSVDEIHLDGPLSDITHSCPLPYTVETEIELDLKLDNLIKAQGFELSVIPPDHMALRSDENNMKAETSSSTILIASTGLYQRAPSFSDELTRVNSTSHWFSFSLARSTRSLIFKEGSGPTQVGPTNVTPKSNKANTNGRTRNSPLGRLLDPLLKNKVANQKKPPVAIQIPENERCKASTVKGLVHLTVKIKILLFKFVIKTRNEILASTVKTLSTFGKDDGRWLCTLYSFHQVRKKSGGWKDHKAKTCGFSYNIIIQMKVCGQKSGQRYMVKESVLYSVDLSTATSEFRKSGELAAIVVKMPKTLAKIKDFPSLKKMENWEVQWSYYMEAPTVCQMKENLHLSLNIGGVEDHATVGYGMLAAS